MSTLSTLTSAFLKEDVISEQSKVGVLQITGADGKKLLQGQTTCNINLLSNEQSLYGAICSVKGRIITNFFLAEGENSILMLMDKNLVEKTLLHLKKYAVFFKVKLSDATQIFDVKSHFQTSDETFTPEFLNETLPTHKTNELINIEVSSYPSKQIWTIHPANSNTSQEEKSDSADILSLLAARPLITLEQSEETLPQWLNMQRTGGISFKKGCYTGQEIVARMQYRGKSKKQLALFTWEGTIDHTQPLLNEDGKVIGQIFNVANTKDTYAAQVILSIEPEEANRFILDGIELTILPLPYKLENTKD